MIELTVRLSDIDYDTLAETLLPALEGHIRQSGMGLLGGASSGVAKVLLRGMSRQKKDELLVKYLNANSEKLADKLEGVAESKGISLHIDSAAARNI